MKKSCLAVGLAFGVLTLSATAQTTNNLNTALGRSESRLDVLIGQGFGDVGSLSLNQEEVRVRACESRNMATGDKLYGLSVALGKGGGNLRLLVDDDELDGLIDSVTRLTVIKTDDVTTLPGFEANFTTKAGLRVTAHNDRREGTVQTYLQFADSPRITLTSIQIQQLGALLQQGRKTLDALKAGN